MKRLDADAVSGAIAGFYQAAYDHAVWPETIEHLCRLFDGSKACICRHGPNLTPDDVVTTPADPVYAKRFIDEHAYQPNPLLEAYEAAPVGVVYNDHDLVGTERLRRSRFWNEWMAPQDMYGGLAGKVMRAGASTWFVDVQRGRHQDGFDGADAELLQTLLPHLRRAAEIGWRFRTNSMLASAFAHLTHGVVMVDGNQQIVSLNAAADAVFTRGDLVCRMGRLASRDTATTRALHQLIADVCRHSDGIPGTGGDLLIRCPHTDLPQLSLSVAPLKGEAAHGDSLAVVFIRELDGDRRDDMVPRLQSLFGFTRKEAEIGAALTTGRSLKEAAARGQIGITTARTHLAAMLRKTHTTGQVQLVALLIRATC